MQQYRAFAPDVRRLYESTSLTYDEIARELGITNGTVSRSVRYLKQHEGLRGRGCGKNNRPRHKRAAPSPIGGRVYHIPERDALEYADSAICFRCGVPAKKHGPSCKMVSHPTDRQILSQPSYVDRFWEREAAQAYAEAASK